MALVLAVEDNLVKGAAGPGDPEHEPDVRPARNHRAHRLARPALGIRGWLCRSGGAALRQHFCIGAPRMAVRSRLPWPWRAVVGVDAARRRRRHVVVGVRLRPDLRRVQSHGDPRRRIAALETEAAGMRAENAAAPGPNDAARKASSRSRRRAGDAVEAGDRAVRTRTRRSRRSSPSCRSSSPTRTSRSGCRSSASSSSASARTHGATACWSCAAATRRTSSRATSRCRSTVQPRPPARRRRRRRS